MFARIKQWLGRVGVSVQIDCQTQIGVSETEFPVHIRITAAQDQQVQSVTVRLIRWYVHTVTRNGNRERERVSKTVSERRIETPFDLKAGQVVEESLELATPGVAAGQARASLDNIGGVAGSITRFMADTLADNPYGPGQHYYVKAVVDVKGAAFDPSAKVDIVFIP